MFKRKLSPNHINLLLYSQIPHRLQWEFSATAVYLNRLEHDGNVLLLRAKYLLKKLYMELADSTRN